MKLGPLQGLQMQGRMPQAGEGGARLR
jgi:hypothetical protein